MVGQGDCALKQRRCAPLFPADWRLPGSTQFTQEPAGSCAQPRSGHCAVPGWWEPVTGRGNHEPRHQLAGSFLVNTPELGSEVGITGLVVLTEEAPPAGSGERPVVGENAERDPLTL